MKLEKIVKKSRKLNEMLEQLLLESAAETVTEPDISNSYAVVWRYKESEKLRRAGLARGFKDPRPAESLDEEGFSPFDSIEPWKSMGRTEMDEDEMVWIPEFWYYAYKDTKNKCWTWAVSPTAQEGFSRHPGSGRYVGRYHSSGTKARIASKTGEEPLTMTDWNDFKALSEAKGKGWGMMDTATWSAIQLLYLVEFADFDSAHRLGNGYKSWEPGVTGETDRAKYHTVKRFESSNQYRWIEDPFANVFDWVDGFIGSQETCRIMEKDAGFGLPESGWIKNFGYSDKAPWAFVPSRSSDDETAIPNYTWSSSTSLCPAFVGGNYFDCANYGLFYFVAYGSASYTNANLGSRLQKTL